MKLVVVDKCPLVRQGIFSILKKSFQLKICEEASNVTEAVSVIVKESPDLVLMDLKLGKECGLDIMKKANKEQTKFLIFTDSQDSKDFMKSHKMGVDAYILKSALPEEIVYAIGIVNKGKKYYDPSVISMLSKGNDKYNVEQLTERERDVLVAISKGMKNKEIAKELFVTEYTVKKHVSQILLKLDLKDRTQAAIYAVSNGIK